MYLHDMANTKGHVSQILDGKWSPKSEQHFCTCSQDGTIRLWDLESKLVGMEQNLQHVNLIKVRDARGGRLGVQSLTYG
jgi:WD40 repeat protein